LSEQLGERRIHAAVVFMAERRHVFFEGHAYVLSKVNTLHPGAVEGDVQDGLRSPMPGEVIALLVEVGASVMKGAPWSWVAKKSR
jgi:3-methylcrotonyl-CoA carboxylase alpha subunit